MNDLITTLLTTAAVIATLTQVIKDKLGLSGSKATILAVLLGAAVGYATLQPAAATLLPGLPAIAGSAVLGLLAGIVASGGYKTVTGLQDRAAELRASLPAPTPPVIVQPQVTVPVDPVPAAPIEVLAPTAETARPLLPAAMAQLPD